MRKILLLIFSIQINCMCIAQIIHKDSVVYENGGEKLILYNDSTFIYKKKGIDIAPLQGIGDDTISYGKFIKYKNKSFYLYSHPDIISENLEVIGSETNFSNFGDSIKIVLSSPFSVQRNLYPELLNDAYFYMVTLQYVDSISLQEKKEFSSPQWFLHDTMILHPVKPIQQIHIYIYPYKQFSFTYPYYHYLYATYSLKDYKSNFISLYIPQFTACYIQYERFYAQEVEILDDCTISINKKTLLSKCKGKKFNDEWKYIVFERKNPYGEDEY